MFLWLYKKDFFSDLFLVPTTVYNCIYGIIFHIFLWLLLKYKRFVIPYFLVLTEKKIKMIGGGVTGVQYAVATFLQILQLFR